MTLKFTKMQGLGNDFLMLDGISQSVHLTPDRIVTLANRHTGVGFDQLLLVESSDKEGIDFNYRIFNANGQEVGQCGNGARCLALFVKACGLTSKNHLTIATKTTVMDLVINKDDTVTVVMPRPQLAPEAIPFIAPRQAKDYKIELENGTILTLQAISVGNPHAVLLVPDVSFAPLHALGQQISTHPRFPLEVNVGFMQRVNDSYLRLRVYERGCGETQACGSGAVAAAAIGRLYHEMGASIRVSLIGGDLLVEWPEIEGPIRLTGPATFVYEGKLY